MVSQGTDTFVTRKAGNTRGGGGGSWGWSLKRGTTVLLL